MTIADGIINAPKWGPRLARLYSADVRRLEAIHADRLSPGAKTWEQAVELLFQRMVKAGPVKGAKLVQRVADYLGSIDKDARCHLLIAFARGRTSSATAEPWWQRRTNDWRKGTSLREGQKRLRGNKIGTRTAD